MLGVCELCYHAPCRLFVPVSTACRKAQDTHAALAVNGSSLLMSQLSVQTVGGKTEEGVVSIYTEKTL